MTTNNQDDFSLSSFSLWREDTYIRPVLDQILPEELLSNSEANKYVSDIGFHSYTTPNDLVKFYFLKSFFKKLDRI
jgi:hypothetical protein